MHSLSSLIKFITPFIFQKIFMENFNEIIDDNLENLSISSV